MTVHSAGALCVRQEKLTRNGFSYAENRRAWVFSFCSLWCHISYFFVVVEKSPQSFLKRKCAVLWVVEFWRNCKLPGMLDDANVMHEDISFFVFETLCSFVQKSSPEAHSNARCELTLSDLPRMFAPLAWCVCLFALLRACFRGTLLSTKSTRAWRLKHTVIHTQFVTLTPSVWFI